MPDYGPPPSPQDLQFQHAEPIAAAASSEGAAQTCVVCKQPVGDTYYHAQGQVVCPLCAQRIQSGQQAPPALSLMRAALYGGGAALGGCILYALVAIVLNAEIGLIAILVGWMVGKAIRHASNGLRRTSAADTRRHPDLLRHHHQLHPGDDLPDRQASAPRASSSRRKPRRTAP